MTPERYAMEARRLLHYRKKLGLTGLTERGGAVSERTINEEILGHHRGIKNWKNNERARALLNAPFQGIPQLETF